MSSSGGLLRHSGGRGGPPFGHAQRVFINKTRSEIQANPKSFFKGKDWTRISPAVGPNTCLNISDMKLYAENFYVKPLAVWIPHLVIPDHVPSCPHCKACDGVDPNASLSNFVAKPKILYGIGSHRYLDTVYYFCNWCKRSFTGYHEESLKLDSNKILGLFNFHVSKGIAVDEELYSYIISHAHDTTASIYRSLALATTDKYIDSTMFYYRAVEAKVVKPLSTGVVTGNSTQRTIDSMIEFVAPPTATQKKRKLASAELARARRNLQAKESQLSGDVKFANLLDKKANRNNLGQPFKGLGKSKLELLMALGITTAKELIAYDGGCSQVLPHWRGIAEAYYDAIEVEVLEMRERVRKLEDEVDLLCVVMEMEQEEEGLLPPLAGGGTTGATTTNADQDGPDDSNEEDPQYPPFSSLMDQEKYNARCPSKSLIDRITQKDHQYRKQVQDAKMQNIKASILKIDWSYKLPPKVKVYVGRGDSFSPFKSHVNIQNEDAMTVFWKMYPFTESYAASGMQPNLVRLKERFDVLGCSIQFIYMDNCCNVRSLLTSVFDVAEVKLDEFHWQARWDDVLYDTNSPEAAVFRGLMRRAVFVVETPEFERVKEALHNKMKRAPTNAEIMKEAKATIPPPDILEQRVEAVLRYVCFNDCLLELESMSVTGGNDAAQDNGVRPKRFMKRMNKDVKKTIRNQMSHVKKGCLSDPPAHSVRIHRVNPMTGKAFTARSTGTNEVDNRTLLTVLNTPSIGIAHAERVCGDHYEQANDRKRVIRLGEPEQLTSRTEKLYLLNSVAKSCGYDDDKLPVPSVCCPPTFPVKEFMGLTFDVPEYFKNDSNDSDEANDAAAEDDFVNFLAGIDFEQEDVPVDADHLETLLGTSGNANANENGDTEDDLLEPLPLDATQIEIEVAKHLPAIQAKESTMETFKRLTQEQPWVPFIHPKDPRSPKDEAEYDLFETMRASYDRYAAYLGASKGYKKFAEAWDLEVAKRYKARMEAIDNGLDAEEVLITRKTAQQLIQHYDRLLEHARRACLVRQDDPVRKELDDTLRNTRRNMAVHQGAHVCSPSPYNNALGHVPFGAPTALNTGIAAAGVQYTPMRNDTAPYVLRPVTENQRHPKTSSTAWTTNFKRNKYCVKCGFSKRMHIQCGTPFGHQCSGNCAREECSKCHERLEFHDTPFVTGPYCRKVPSQSSAFFDWYKNNTPETEPTETITD